MSKDHYDFATIATEIPGCEGPVFDLNDNFYVVSPPNGSILRIDTASGDKVEHANTGGIPAGLQVDRQNCLWVADMKKGVLKVEPDGQVVHVVKEYQGKPIRGCNDCAFDSNGNLFFTAPAGSNASNPVGEVYCLTGNGEVVLLDNGYAFSNGLAVSADDSVLIVAETHTKSLWAYDIIDTAKLQNKRLFAKLPGDDEGGPDGMDCDTQGNLLVAHWKGGSIDVFDPQGGLLERIALPLVSPSNLHFGGSDKQSLYITELSSGVVLQTRWKHPGQPTYSVQAG